MELKKSKELATAAMKTADKLEKDLEPFLAQNAISIVAPVKQYLENHLRLIDKEIENEKLTPEDIKKQSLDEQERVVEAAKRRMQERQERQENNAKLALEEAAKAVKVAKKSDKKTKEKAVELKSTPTSRGGEDTGAASNTDELTEEQKAALVTDGGRPEGGAGEELTEEQKAALAADDGGAEDENEEGDELTDEEKALLGAEQIDAEAGKAAAVVESPKEKSKKSQSKKAAPAATIAAQEPLI